jgi:hypothetical protein
LKSRKVSGKIVPLKKLKTKGVVTTDLRVKRILSKTGNSACVFIPADFLQELNWKPGETAIYVTVNEKGELIVTPAAQAKVEKTA